MRYVYNEKCTMYNLNSAAELVCLDTQVQHVNVLIVNDCVLIELVVNETSAIPPVSKSANNKEKASGRFSCLEYLTDSSDGPLQLQVILKWSK